MPQHAVRDYVDVKILVRPLAVLVAFGAALSAQTTAGWKLVWSDEFNGSAGSAPDPSKWNYDLGGGGWGNGESETYTNSTANAFQDGNGNLVIRAIRDSSGNYTSSRLQTGAPGASTHTTEGNWQYGLIEARIKLPFGKGIWPAFWMLGENFGAAGWPACGELDIMENFGTYGNNAAVNNGTAHGPGYSGVSGITKAYRLPLGQTMYDDYHVYSIQWAPNSIQWFVDGVLFQTVTPASLPAGQKWVFNAPFFILLNLAVGGNTTFLGAPDPDAPFPPQDMLVDYVRVYEAATVAGGTPVITPGSVMNAASYLGDLAPGGLATLQGANLAGGSVSVNGVPAPVVYASSTQINFQVPWETVLGPYVPIQVISSSAPSETEPVTLAAPEAPAMFLSELTYGTAWVTGAGCDITECAVQQGGAYQLWANALGPKNAPLNDGQPAIYNGSLASLEVPGSPASCQLTIGGQVATVTYCGAAPGEIIDQVNFVYPVGAAAAAGAAYVDATLTIGKVTGRFRVPAPATASQLAVQTLALMTQNEKLQLVQGGATSYSGRLPRGAGGVIPGIPRLGIPDLYFCDGSVGVANSEAPATALPSAIASAATWDLDLAYQYGKVIGTELRAYGLNINLGGNVNLNREPRDGRTFEAKGEDPILAGKINAAHMRGTQDQNILGVIKHYALNDQESSRDTTDAIIDERAARETDLLAFEIGVRDAPALSVMCAYNLVNGTYSCENAHLLSDILKGDWGFQGFVMSDWGATQSTVAAANAGLDQEQPDNQHFSLLGAAIQSGAVPQSRLDDMVTRILRSIYQAGLTAIPNTITPVDTDTDQAIAQAVEEEGAVLLKNAGGQLPLSPTVPSIAVIGSHADIGALSGGGSAQVYPAGGVALMEGYPTPPGWDPMIWDPSPPLRAIQAKAPNAKLQYDDGTDAARAAALAASSGAVIVFVNQWTGEGMDMPSLNFTDLVHANPINQDALVSAVAAANPHTIVVMENGGAQVLPWLGSVAAVLEAWFPGQRGGEAIANILFGDVNPSGKLPVTFPAGVSDLPHPVIATPVSPGSTAPFAVNYSEGLLVGYKWYDAMGIAPVFPFGFGLSYTTFAIGNVKLTNLLSANRANFKVACDVSNTGPVSGAEVVQVYLGLPAALGEPPRRLVGWNKVTVAPGTTQHVTIEVDQGDSSHPLSWWNPASQAWEIAPGEYAVWVGNSSAASDLTLAGTLHIGS